MLTCPESAWRCSPQRISSPPPEPSGSPGASADPVKPCQRGSTWGWRKSGYIHNHYYRNESFLLFCSVTEKFCHSGFFFSGHSFFFFSETFKMFSRLAQFNWSCSKSERQVMWQNFHLQMIQIYFMNKTKPTETSHSNMLQTFSQDDREQAVCVSVSQSFMSFPDFVSEFACPPSSPMVLVCRQVAAAAGQKVTRLTEELQKLLFMVQTHDDRSATTRRTWDTRDNGRRDNEGTRISKCFNDVRRCEQLY